MVCPGSIAESNTRNAIGTFLELALFQSDIFPVVDNTAVVRGDAYAGFAGTQDTDVLEPDVFERAYGLRAELESVAPACEKAVSDGYVLAGSSFAEGQIAAEFNRIVTAGRVAVFIPHGVDMAVNDQNVFALGQVEPVPAGFDGYVVDKHIFAETSRQAELPSQL